MVDKGVAQAHAPVILKERLENFRNNADLAHGLERASLINDGKSKAGSEHRRERERKAYLSIRRLIVTREKALTRGWAGSKSLIERE